jgi:hypothetical protein
VHLNDFLAGPEGLDKKTSKFGLKESKEIRNKESRNILRVMRMKTTKAYRQSTINEFNQISAYTIPVSPIFCAFRNPSSPASRSSIVII